MQSSTSTPAANTVQTSDGYTVTPLDCNIVVTGNDVRLRVAPSLSAGILQNQQGYNYHPDKGQSLKCIGETDEFYQVIFREHKVFISKKFSVIEGLSE